MFSTFSDTLCTSRQSMHGFIVNSCQIQQVQDSFQLHTWAASLLPLIQIILPSLISSVLPSFSTVDQFSFLGNVCPSLLDASASFMVTGCDTQCVCCLTDTQCVCCFYGQVSSTTFCFQSGLHPCVTLLF